MKKFTNKMLKFVSFFTSTFGKTKHFEIPEGYELIHSDNFEKIDFDYWGRYSPDGFFKTGDIKVYWDSIHAIDVHDNTLELTVEHRPRRFHMDDIYDWQRAELGYREVPGDPDMRVFDIHNLPVFPNQNDVIDIPYVMGILDSKKSYRYGIFKIDFMFPKGKQLWPSFWMTGAESWPPEIDIFEGYTREGTIEPNVHYGDCGENHKFTGATRVHMCHKHDRWHEAVCWWEKDFIKIYYDGRLVYKVTDKDVLKWFDNKTLNIILNCNIAYWKNGEFEEEPVKQTLKFKNFRIYQKEGESICR